MKLISSFALVCIASISMAQHAEPAVKDNIIYINSALSADSLFTQIGKRMVQVGFALKTTNHEFSQITGRKEMAIYYDYDLIIVLKGQRAEIKATVINDDLQTYRWYYMKQKNTKNGYVHTDILETFAGLGVVSYDRK